MAIYRLFKKSPLGPEEILAMTEAYEQTLNELRIGNRSAPITEKIAAKIIAIPQTGETNPGALCERTIEELGISRL